MPFMREMRKSNRAIDLNEAKEVLKKGEYGILSYINEEGAPVGIPLNYAWLDNALYFHCAREGEKLDGIRNNKSVSFTVVGQTEVLPDQFSTKFESVILHGEAVLLEGQEKQMALESLIEKYSPDFHPQGMKYIASALDDTEAVKIEVLKISGKARK